VVLQDRSWFVDTVLSYSIAESSDLQEYSDEDVLRTTAPPALPSAACGAGLAEDAAALVL